MGNGADPPVDLQAEVAKRKAWFFECQLRRLNLENFRARSIDESYKDPLLDLISEPLLTMGFPGGQFGRMENLGQVYLDSEEPVWTGDERARRDAFAKTLTGQMCDWLEFREPYRLAEAVAKLRKMFEESQFSSRIDVGDLDRFWRKPLHSDGGWTDNDSGDVAHAISRAAIAQSKPWLIGELYTPKHEPADKPGQWLENVEQFILDVESELGIVVGGTAGKNINSKIQAYGKTFDAQVFEAFTIQVPEGYKAISAYVQHTNVTYDSAQTLGHEMEVYIGSDYYVRFGPDHNVLNKYFTMNGESGTMPVTLRSRKPVLQFNFAVGINCQRMDKALEQWQLKTHATTMAGYQRQRAEYLDQLSRYQAAVRTQLAMAHNFAHDSAMERQELKKAFIHLLMSEHFPKVYIPTPDPQAFPPDPFRVKQWGAVVAFFERAFEWENLMYVYYPYFWGRTARWGELILTQDLDPQFEAFLRAGAARVVVPARPGFEAALAHYHETGDVWMGEEIPDMFSKQYVSIIAEIKARNAAPGEEVCVAEWDVRLPTTLVMLKDDAKLPEWTPEKECTPPVDE